MKSVALLIGLGLVLALPARAQGWLARYDGPAGDEDYARGIVADGTGAVYVTGASWGDGTSYDYATVKYGPGGAELWVRRYDGPAQGSDEATAIAAFGNRIAVTGGSARADLYTDIVTIVYDTDGNELWTARFNGPNDGNDMGRAVTFDAEGNVIVAGYSIGTDILWDLVTVKYDPEGEELWSARYSTDDEDYAVAVAADAEGNVVVTGPSGCPYTFAWDYLTVKYDADGEELWVVRYNGPADEHDEPRALALDAAGNILVTGGSTSHGSGTDFTTIKYSPAGETLWVRRYDGPAGGPDWANGIALDDDGNVYVTGSSRGETTDDDFATVKYDADGTELWVARYDGPVSGFDEARAIAVDETGVYVTGSSFGDGTRTDYATVKYTTAGGEQWVRRYDGPAARFDEAVAIVTAGTDGVVITGSSVGTGTGTDYATLRYHAIGVSEEPGPRGPEPAQGFATIVRGRLYLEAGRPVLLDATGRRVMELRPGENDLTRLAPGVYFVLSPTGDVKHLGRVVIGR
ncbi:MAG TPA: hypothetical protein ENN51_07475 [candidate division WOR-3 bacterium]|uniref:Bulb-type lectin domain-containing protein n=1 Tax=candidate division WOR-3 bacterium TaxID=2052148 RepID=A0A7V0XFJ3_UNCW3|nr:hypothetical protein [candidate division WOR-3 bacterium]